MSSEYLDVKEKFDDVFDFMKETIDNDSCRSFANGFDYIIDWWIQPADESVFNMDTLVIKGEGFTSYRAYDGFTHEGLCYVSIGLSETGIYPLSVDDEYCNELFGDTF